jgi:hypothetical protein
MEKMKYWTGTYKGEPAVFGGPEGAAVGEMILTTEKSYTAFNAACAFNRVTAGGSGMTPEEREERAHGNVNLSNPNVTREVVDKAAEDLERDELRARLEVYDVADREERERGAESYRRLYHESLAERLKLVNDRGQYRESCTQLQKTLNTTATERDDYRALSEEQLEILKTCKGYLKVRVGDTPYARTLVPELVRLLELLEKHTDETPPDVCPVCSNGPEHCTCE